MTHAWITLFMVVCISVLDASYFEKKLLNDLLSKGQNKYTRPVLNDNDTITVKIGLSLSQIIDVDEKNQFMITNVWTRQEWYNPYLRWNKTEYGNITSINVLSSHLWVPDMVLYNNVDPSINFRGNLDKLSTRVKLFHDGWNKWLAPVILRSACKINIKYFPFDSHSCMMKFGSWTYDGYKLDVRNESDRVDLMMYVKSAEWNLESAPVKRNVLKYFCCPEPFPDVTFYFNIQRRSLFYLTNLILPLIMISILIIVVFILPPQSGERISLSITLLLFMMVYMLFIIEIIPGTSEDVPLIAKFYIAVMFEMALALIVTCYVLRCYHSGTYEVPRWMRVTLVTKLGRFLGVTNSERLLLMKEEEASCGSLNKEGVVYKQTMNNELKQFGDIENGMGNRKLDDNAEKGQALLAEDETSCLTKCRKRTCDSIAKKMLRNLEIISDNVQAKRSEEKIREQWLVIATVIDRVAMWTFTTAIFTTIFVIFYQSPDYVS